MRLGSFAALAILFATVSFAGAQDQASKLPSTEEMLTRPVVVPSGPPLSASSAFEDLMFSAGIPGGQVLEEGCNAEVGPQTHLKGNTLRELLDSFAGVGSPYRWEVKDGVVNLLPAKGSPALLLTRIATYDSQKAADIVTATTFLLASPKIQDAAAELGLTQNVSGSGVGSVGPGPPPPREPLGLRLQNVTLRDLLNALVRINGRGVWTYREIHCPPKNYFDVTISR